MFINQRYPQIRLILVIFLFALTSACDVSLSPPTPTPFPYYLQEIVPTEQEPVTWYLSPTGEKLLYDTKSSFAQPKVRFLSTGQEVEIENCQQFQWLDENALYCDDMPDYPPSHPPAVVMISEPDEAEAISRSLIHDFNPEEQTLDQLLAQAEAIYRLKLSFSDPGFLLVFGQVSSENMPVYYQVKDIKNLDTVLADYPSITILISGRFASSSKVYSPNEQYYYILQDETGHTEDAYLKLYEAASDKLLAEYHVFSSDPHFRIGGVSLNDTKGWASDSSGVYFQIYWSGGFTGPAPPIEPILKLTVPE